MDKFIKLTKNDGKVFYVLKEYVLEIHEYNPDQYIRLAMRSPMKNIFDQNCNSCIVINKSNLSFNGEVANTSTIYVLETIEEIVNKMKE